MFRAIEHEWPVEKAKDADLEIPAANFPNFRLLTIPRDGSQEPLDNFDGAWQVCSPETVTKSAVGYFFGRQLHQTLGVPIGLIDNATHLRGVDSARFARGRCPLRTPAGALGRTGKVIRSQRSDCGLSRAAEKVE